MVNTKWLRVTDFGFLMVEDGGKTVLIASSLATAAPVAMSTMAAAAQTKSKAMLTIPFVKLNTLLN
jgi:hypothetical protein